MDTLDLDLRHMGRTPRRLIIGLSDSESVIVEAFWHTRAFIDKKALGKLCAAFGDLCKDASYSGTGRNKKF